MVALGKSGKLFLFSRRGELQAGFPISLPENIASPLLLNKTPSPSLQSVTLGGEILDISFSGEIIKKTQAQKSNRDDKFRSLSDQKGNSSLLVLEQFNKIQLFDSQQRLLMTLPLAGSKAWLGYFDFGLSQKIISMTDLEQGLGYLYDLEGNLLISSPLQSNGEIQLSHLPSQGQYLIRTRYGKTLLEYLIPD